MSPAAAAIGIDIGAERLHVATSLDARDPVHVLELSDPSWAEQLIALIQPGAVVTFEPTGWHYSAPIVAALEQTNAQIIQVEHRITGKVRDLRIAAVKNDKTDARALCYIATQHTTTPLLGTHQLDPRSEDKVVELRLLMSDYLRAAKERTRSTNRLHQLAHSIWPSLDQKLNVYLRAIDAGAISPHQLRQLAADLSAGQTVDGYEHKTNRTSLINLVQTLPAWLTTDALTAAIDREAQRRSQHVANTAALDAEISALIAQPPFARVTRVWATIPQASLLAIAALHVATHGQAHELTEDQFKAAVGSHPRISQSGETSESAAAKQGYRPAKTALYLWTLRLIKAEDNPVAAAYHRHADAAEKRRHNMQAGRGKLCKILSVLARTGQIYQPRP